jgi:hypothetical protein
MITTGLPRGVEVCGDEAAHTGTGEGRPPSQTFIQHTGQRVDIGAGILVGVVAQPLGCHVGEGANHVAGTCQPGLVGGTGDPVIATGMAKKPDQRYPTTVELANAARDAITTPIPRPATQSPVQHPQPSSQIATNPAPPTPALRAQRQPGHLNLAATPQRPPEGGAGWPYHQQEIQRAQRPPPYIGTPPPPPAGQRRRRRVKWALITALIVILAAADITGYLMRQPSTTSQPSTISHPSTTSQPSTGTSHQQQTGDYVPDHHRPAPTRVKGKASTLMQVDRNRAGTVAGADDRRRRDRPIDVMGRAQATGEAITARWSSVGSWSRPAGGG